MSCENIEPDLIGYHFGTLEPAARAEVEAHLLECRACLRAFVALKRDLELSEAEPRPSPAARARLRQAMAAELAGPTARPWRWWERPFAFGVAALALMLAVLTVQAVSTTSRGPLNGMAHRPFAVGARPTH